MHPPTEEALILNKHGWNVMFAHFPNFRDGRPYRVYKINQQDSNKPILLGCGTTSEEAILEALKS